MPVSLAATKAPPAAPPPAPASPCANCGAPLSVGQDWCLECGTAVPGRFGRGPGLRSSLGVVGVTLLLVTGAVAAAYAVLSSDSKQATQTTASVPAAAPAPAPPPGAPAAAPPAALPVPPKPPPATPTPAPAPPAAPKAAPAGAPKPKAPAAAPKAKAKAPPPSSTAPTARSAKILLDTDAASTYNPYGLPSTAFGDPAKAIDGDPTTSWTYQLDPGTAGRTQVGLAVNLKAPQQVRAITIATPSPGMTVEFYGATGAQPVSISDPAWLHLANRRHIGASTTVALRTRGQALDYLLVWITHAPPGLTAGTLGISELSVTS